MAHSVPEKNTLQIGLGVEINPQHDRTRKQLVIGVIKEILTNSSSHPHGILVSLENGEKGRVKKITGSSSQTPKSSSSNIESNTPASLPDILKVISGGENHYAEFKSSMLWSAKLTSQQIQISTSREIKKYGKNASKFIIAKSIAGFLNTDGGDLIIGIKENKDGGDDEIIGIESEFPKLKDQCIDGYRRMVVDDIIRQYFPKNIFNQINLYIQIDFEKIDRKIVCRIHANKSDTKVFITHKNESHFYVRIDASTRVISGEEVVDYCMKRFA